MIIFIFLADNSSKLTQVLAKTRLFESSERRRHVSLVVGIDEDGACLETVRHSQSLAEIIGEDARRQPVLRHVGALNDVINVTA